MATRGVSRIKLPGRDESLVALYKWAGLLNGDDGEPIELNDFADKSFQIYGTAGAGLSVVLQGDSSEAADQWFSLLKGDGSALALTTVPSGAQILDHPLRVRPLVAAGDGSTSITALLYIVGKG